jgi:hypothetical protein
MRWHSYVVRLPRRSIAVVPCCLRTTFVISFVVAEYSRRRTITITKKTAPFRVSTTVVCEQSRRIDYKLTAVKRDGKDSEQLGVEAETATVGVHDEYRIATDSESFIKPLQIATDSHLDKTP